MNSDDFKLQLFLYRLPIANCYESSIKENVFQTQVLLAYSPTMPSPSRSSIYLYNQSYIKVIGIHCLILKEPHIIDISKMCDLILIFFSTNAPFSLSTNLHKVYLWRLYILALLPFKKSGIFNNTYNHNDFR